MLLPARCCNPLPYAAGSMFRVAKLHHQVVSIQARSHLSKLLPYLSCCNSVLLGDLCCLQTSCTSFSR
jgi:hypothetical protein